MKFIVSPDQDIMLNPEDWSHEEWMTICKVFGSDSKFTEMIRIPKGTVELWNVVRIDIYS